MADEKEKKVTGTKTAEKKTAKTESKEVKSKEVKAESKTNKTENKEVKAVKKENKETKTAAKTVAKTESKSTTKTANKKVETKQEVDEEVFAKAEAKYARISSRKVGIVANLIRGKDVDEAMAILQFTPKAASEMLTKLLKSAIANAENNNGMEHSKLYIAEIYSNQGPTLKRIRPAAKGSAVRIRKRTSNTTIILKEHN